MDAKDVIMNRLGVYASEYAYWKMERHDEGMARMERHAFYAVLDIAVSLGYVESVDAGKKMLDEAVDDAEDMAMGEAAQ